MVICLERGADLHTVQRIPLPLTVSCISKIQTGLPFWYRITRVVPDKEPLNGCVCVCVCVCQSVRIVWGLAVTLICLFEHQRQRPQATYMPVKQVQ